LDNSIIVHIWDEVELFDMRILDNMKVEFSSRSSHSELSRL